MTLEEIKRIERVLKRNGLILSRKVRLALLQDGRCGPCGKKLNTFDFNIDHIVPKSLGGTDANYNVQATHKLCNTKKGNRLLPTNKCVWSEEDELKLLALREKAEKLEMLSQRPKGKVWNW